MVLPPIFCGVRFRLICFTLFLRKACRDIAARPSRPLYLEVNMALICCDSSGVETEKVLMSRAFPIDPPDNFRSNSPYFTMFSLLPAELRVQIWQHTLPDQRWLSKLPFPRPPVALSICQESRQVALKNLTPLYRDPYAYVNFSCDIIDADFLGDFECTLTETEIASIQNLAIRRFDPESDNPATVWQRNPTYRGWPLCAFRFNCSTPPWGTPDLRGWVLTPQNLGSLKICHLIVPSRTQMVYLGGKIMDFEEVIKTMRTDLDASSKLMTNSTACACQSPCHPEIQLVEEVTHSNVPSLIPL